MAILQGSVRSSILEEVVMIGLRTLFFAIATMIFAFMSATPSSAAIKCKDGYQIVKGYGYISTPKCEDRYLARVARSYGHKISANTIHNNPNEKIRICHYVGSDIRVQHICAPYYPRNFVTP